MAKKRTIKLADALDRYVDTVSTEKKDGNKKVIAEML